MSPVSLAFSTNHRYKPIVLVGNWNSSCSAVSKTMQILHSHQEQPTHGDIKPANILFRPPQEAAGAVLVSENAVVQEENYEAGHPFLEAENRMGLPPQPPTWATSHRRGRLPMRTSVANAEATRAPRRGWICDQCSATAAAAASMVECSREGCAQHTCATDSQDWGPDESINVYLPWDRGLENSDWSSTECRPNGWTSSRCDSCTLEKSSSSFTSLGNETLDEAPY